MIITCAEIETGKGSMGLLSRFFCFVIVCVLFDFQHFIVRYHIAFAFKKWRPLDRQRAGSRSLSTF